MDPAIASSMSHTKELLGCIALGATFGTTIYGITILQTYIYFRRYPNDHVSLKILVGVLLILDTLTASIVAYILYAYMVSHFGAPMETFDLIMNPPFAVENCLNVFIATLAQCFLARRLWLLSKNKHLVGIIVALSIASLGPGIAITVHCAMWPSVLSFDSLEVRILAGFANGGNSLCDVVIAGGLSYYLRVSRSGFSRTNTMVDRLMIYAIQCGALTAICQFAHMLSVLAFPEHAYFYPFAFMQAKLYCNTLLATLNVRNSMKTTTMAGELLEPGSLILSSISRSGGSRSNDITRGTYPIVGTESLATIEFKVSSTKDNTSTLMDHNETNNKV